MPYTVQHFSVNSKGRDFAIGDIHGCFSRVEETLNTVHFDPEVDRLFAVGDLVDRGNQSDQVLQWLQKPWFHAILGNHDAMTIEAAKGDPFYYADHAYHGGQWFYQIPQAQQLVIQEALEKLPLIITVDTPDGTVALVHADFPYDDWLKMDLTQIHETDAQYCLWSRDRYQHQYALPVQNIKAIVHGHTPVHHMLKLGNAYFIDTGGWGSDKGRFTLLNLNTLMAYEGPSNTARDK